MVFGMCSYAECYGGGGKREVRGDGKQAAQQEVAGNSAELLHLMEKQWEKMSSLVEGCKTSMYPASNLAQE